MWNAIQDHFKDDHAYCDSIALNELIQQACQKENESIDEYILRFSNLKLNYENSGGTISDNHYAKLFNMGALPICSQAIRSNMYTIGKALEYKP